MGESFPGHKCQLFNLRSDTYLPRLLPTASWTQKLVHYLQASIIVSRKNPITARNFFSHAAIAKENRRLAKLPYYIIHPCSCFSAIWYIIILFTYAICLIIVPYACVFYVDNSIYSKRIAPTVGIFGSCVFYLEILIKLNSGYYDNQNEMFELNRSKIRKNYLKSTLFPDIIAAFPTPLIITFQVQPLSPQFINNLLISFCFTFLFHFLNIPKMIRYYHIISVYFDFTTRTDLMIELFFGSTYAMHILTLARILIPDLIFPKHNRPAILCNEWNCGNALEKYSKELLYTAQAFLGCGFTQMHEMSIYESGVTIFILFFGWICTAAMLIIIIKGVMSHNRSESRYYEFLEEAKEYCRKNNLPDNLTANVYTYIEHKFENNYFNEDKICNTLSVKLKTEIIADSCKELIDQVDIFINLPQSDKKQIMRCLKREIYLTGDIIIKEHDKANYMFFLRRGSATAVSHSGKQVDTFEDGSYFGEIALLLGDEMQNLSIVANDYCETYVLSKADLLTVIKPNSDLLKEMQNIALDRIQKIKRVPETFLEKL